MSHPALADVSLDSLVIAGGYSLADVKDAVIKADVALTIEGASTVELELSDPGRKLLRSQLLASSATILVDDLVFELVKVAKQGNHLQVTFEDAAVGDLRRSLGPRLVAHGTMGRGDFGRLLVKETPWVRHRIYGGVTTKVGLSRGTEQDRQENTWDALGRLAQPVGWRRFCVGNVVTLGPDSWLLTQTEAMVLREHTGGVDDIDFDTDVGRPADTATVACRAERWAALPGQVVRVEDQGWAGDGLWLVQEMRRSLFRITADLTLVRPGPDLPEEEPTAEAESPTSGATDAAADQAAHGGGVGPDIAPGVVSRKGFIWPTKGQVVSKFGPRLAPTAGASTFHKGIDIAAPTGTPVLAAKAGVVVHSGDSDKAGKNLVVDHGNGEKTRYLHLSYREAGKGTKVTQGQRIGLVGTTGNVTGPHLHFEILVNDEALDPLDSLPKIIKPPPGWTNQQ